MGPNRERHGGVGLEIHQQERESSRRRVRADPHDYGQRIGRRIGPLGALDDRRWSRTYGPECRLPLGRRRSAAGAKRRRGRMVPIC